MSSIRIQRGNGGISIGEPIRLATSGSVLFVDSGSSVGQDNTNFFWDNTAKTLNLGSTHSIARLTLTGSAAVAGTGTLSSSGSVVTGVGTAFTTELVIGDVLVAAGQTVCVDAITSDTVLLTGVAFSPVLSANTFTHLRPITQTFDSTGALLRVVTAEGNEMVGKPLLGSSGSLSSEAAFAVIGSRDITTKPRRGFHFQETAVATVASTATFVIGAQFALNIGATNTQNWTNADGFVGTYTNLGIVSGATGTINSFTNIYAHISNSSLTATLTTGIALKIATPAATGTITNYAGIAINVITSPTNHTAILTGTHTIPTGAFSLYNADANPSYFAAKIGIGTTSPSNDLSFGGAANRTIWMERQLTADTAGNSLTIIASGATSGATNKAGGDMVVSSGLSTGSGLSRVRLRTYNNTAASTTDNTAIDIAAVSNLGFELFNTGSAFVTSVTNPVMYGTTNGGASYPFLTAGNLVLQSRTSGANRDIVFAAGTTPAAIMVVDGTNQRVGIMTTAPGFPLDVVGAIQTSVSVKIKGATSGTLTITVPAAVGTNTLTFPAGTTDFSATGGSAQVVKQTSAGGAFTVATVAASEIASPAALTKTDDTNVTLTLGGSPTVALLAATSLTLEWTGTLGVPRGGSGTGTAFTAGSVVFAGTSGIYTQDNSNFFWDDSNNRLGIGTAAPSSDLSFGGNATRLLSMERNTTSDTAGNALSISAGGATSGATNKAGGQLSLSAGTSTGSGLSNLRLFVYGIVAASTSDNTQIRTQTAQAWSESGTDRAATLIDGMLQFNNQLVAYTTDVTLGATARIYGTAATGSSYPFQGAGHLVLQGRPDAGRDIVFATGTTPTTRMFITSAGNVGIGITTGTASQMLHLTAGNILLTGTSPAFTSGVTLQLGGNRTSPVAGNIAFGDGTGWKLFISKGTDDAATQWVTFQDNGRMGVGVTATTPLAFLDAINTTTSAIPAIRATTTLTDPASTTAITVNSNITLSSGNSAASFYGVNATSQLTSGSNNLTTAVGLMGGSFVGKYTSGSGTVTGVAALVAAVQNASAGTITAGVGLIVDTATNSGGGTFATNIGIQVNAQTIGSTAIYGLRSLIVAASTRWNLYIDGTAQNHFRGNVGIGTGSTTPAEALYVNAGKLVLDATGYATSKFNSQGVDWATFGAAPSIIFNGSASDRPEISWIRGSRTYPEFSIRQHTSADVGAQFYAGPGTVAPTFTMTVAAGKVGFGGTAPNQRVDIQSGGLRFSPLATAGAITVALAGLGAGNLTNGVYSYAVNFVNAHGESGRGTSATVTVVDATTNGQVALSAIPTSTDATVTARNVYRSATGQIGSWLLTTISDNTTTTYTDNISDATLKTGALGIPHQGTASGALYTNIVATERKVATFDGSGLRTTFYPSRPIAATTDQQLLSQTPATRGHGVFVYNNGYLYSIGGSAGTNVYYSTVGSLARPEAATTWSTDTAFPVARSNTCGVAIGGYIYVIGGTTANSTTVFSTGTSTVYFGRPNPDGTVSSWQTTTALPAAVSAARCVAYNGYLYVIGGANTSSQAQTSVYYAKLNPDGTVGSWSTSANTLPVALIYHGLAVLNGYLYIYGGRANNGGTGLANDNADNQSATYFSLVNTSTGDVAAWSTSAQSLPVANAFLGSYTWGGYIVAAGGNNTAGSGTSVNYFARPQDCGISDTAGEIGAWTASASNTGNSGVVAAAVAGNYVIYLVGGINVRLMTPAVVRIAGDLDLLAETYRSHNFAGGASTLSGGGSVQCLNINAIGDINTLGTLHVQGLSYFADAIGIRSSSTNILMVDGQAAHTLGMSRNFTSNTAGNSLTIQSGGATSAATNKSAGNLILSSGISTGSGTGSVIIQVSPGIAASTTDNTLITALTISGDKSVVLTGKSYQFNSNADGDFQATGTATTSAGGTPIRHCSAFLNGYLYRMGGDDAVTCTTTIQYAQIAVDGTIAAWTTEATNSLPAARSIAASCIANGYLYHLGGKSTTNQNTATATVYYNKPNPDGSLGTWGTTTALPSVLTGHRAIYYNGYIYVAAGANSASTIQSAVYYTKVNADGTLGAWFTASNALGTAVNLPGMAVANGVLYIYGGTTTGSSTTAITTVQYSVIGSDNSPGAWSNSANSLNTATSVQGAVVANGFLYSIAGIGTSGSSISTVQYSALAASGDVGVWTSSAFTPGGAGSYEVFALNGLLLCVVNNNVAVRVVQLNRLQAATSIDLLGLTASYLTRSGEASALYAGDIYSGSNFTVLGYSQHEGPAQFSSSIGLTGRTTPAKSSGSGNEGGTTFSVLAATGGAASSTSNVTAGLGGIISLTAGTGGAATGASGANIGGAGGTIELIAGTGGAATSGTAGRGGNIYITGGSSTGTSGDVILAYTSAGGLRGTVGIGMASPTVMLDVGVTTNGAIRANQYFIAANNQSAFNASETQSLIYGTGNSGGAYPFLTSGNLVLQSRPSGANRDIVFVTGTSQTITMVIDGTNQRVGIGSPTPQTSLHVAQTASAPAVRGIISAQYSTGTAGAQFIVRHARGTEGSPTTLVTGDNLGGIVFEGYDGSNYLQDAFIGVYGNGTVAATRIATRMEFYTATDAAPSVLTLAATIQNDQTVAFTKKLAIGATFTPTNDLSFGGTAARILWVERHTTSNTAGNNLTLQSGGATSGATDKSSGTLILASGIATGTGSGGINFQTSAPQASTNTTDNAVATRFSLDGRGLVAHTPAVGTGTVASEFLLTCAAHTALTASTERFDVNFNSARTVQWATGALTTQRFNVFQAPTIGFVGSSTVTDAATVAITGAVVKGTNATVTNTHALLVQAGAVSTAGSAYGLTVNTPTGATSNYAAAFLGGNVGIGLANPAYTLDVTGNAHISGNLTVDGTYTPPTNQITHVVAITFDGGGSTLTTGARKAYWRPEFSGTLTKWTLLADQSGSIVVDIWKDTYANFPPTVADTVTASDKPTITTALKAEGSSLTGWTTSFSAGDIYEFNIDSVTSLTKVVLILKFTQI